MINACPRRSLLAAPLLLLLSCSDPVPPPAQGALTMSIGQPITSVPQMNCPIVQTYQVGAVDSKTKMQVPPSMDSPGESVISGQSGASISCSITGGNGNFKFSGSFHGITPQGDGVSVVFSNGQIGADFTGTADVAVSTPQLATQTYSSTMPCSITVLPPPGGTVPPQIKGGSMWAKFSCQQVAYPPSGLCEVGAVGASVIVFENCSGS